MKGGVVLVTGGGQGIGKAVAKRFLEARFQVVIAEQDEEAGAETVDEYRRLGDIRCVHADISQEDAVLHAIEAVRSLGGLDVLVNNAAIAANKPVEQLTLEEWNRVLAVNLTGPFLCAKHSASLLRERQGAVVNIASTRALMSEAQTEAYSASKGGIVALTHALAISLGPEVRVNCISPGWIDVTPWRKRRERQAEALRPEDHHQHPAGRVGRPDDVAELALFLADRAKSGFITGQDFIVDGGMTRKMIYV